MINQFIHRRQTEFGAFLAICIGIVFITSFYAASLLNNGKSKPIAISHTHSAVKTDTVDAGAIVRNLKFKKVNINTADISDLMKLSGVGRTLAKRIIHYREKNGRFKSIDELKKVKGVGDKKLEKIRKFIEL